MAASSLFFICFCDDTRSTHALNIFFGRPVRRQTSEGESRGKEINCPESLSEVPFVFFFLIFAGVWRGAVCLFLPCCPFAGICCGNLKPYFPSGAQSIRTGNRRVAA